MVLPQATIRAHIHWVLLASILIFFAYVYLLMRKKFGLAQVWDASDELIVKIGDEKQRIPLTEIVDVNFDRFLLTLKLRQPSPYGRDVVFQPNHDFLGKLNFFGRLKSPLNDLNDFIKRMDASRRADTRQH
jgi:hypothetical protein